LLADEVGLGKTIEVSLVISQKWAEDTAAFLLEVAIVGMPGERIGSSGG
jgi:hypothetical protein